MRERRWIQKGYWIFFAIALLICVGGIPAYAEEPNDERIKSGKYIKEK